MVMITYTIIYILFYHHVIVFAVSLALAWLSIWSGSVVHSTQQVSLCAGSCMPVGLALEHVPYVKYLIL
jgi:hypothetical protein